MLPPMKAWFPDDLPSLKAARRTRRFCMPDCALKRAPCQSIGSVFTPLWRLSVPEFVRWVDLSKTCLEVKKTSFRSHANWHGSKGRRCPCLPFVVGKETPLSPSRIRGMYNNTPKICQQYFTLYSEVLVRVDQGARNIESQKIRAVP